MWAWIGSRRLKFFPSQHSLICVGVDVVLPKTTQVAVFGLGSDLSGRRGFCNLHRVFEPPFNRMAGGLAQSSHVITSAPNSPCLPPLHYCCWGMSLVIPVQHPDRAVSSCLSLRALAIGAPIWTPVAFWRFLFDVSAGGSLLTSDDDQSAEAEFR